MYMLVGSGGGWRSSWAREEALPQPTDARLTHGTSTINTFDNDGEERMEVEGSAEQRISTGSSPTDAGSGEEKRLDDDQRWHVTDPGSEAQLQADLSSGPASRG